MCVRLLSTYNSYTLFLLGIPKNLEKKKIAKIIFHQLFVNRVNCIIELKTLRQVGIYIANQVNYFIYHT